MRISLLLLALALVTAVGCNSRDEAPPKPITEPVAAAPTPREMPPAPAEAPAVAVQKEAKQSYNTCLEYCVMAMDQAGQVTDDCPKDCRANPDMYTEADLLSDDQDNGLIAFPDCLKGCPNTADGMRPGAECKQSCCVESCVLRQEYKGSGSAAKASCPAMCREFLQRTANN